MNQIFHSKAQEVVRQGNAAIKTSKSPKIISLLLHFVNSISWKIPLVTCGMFDFDWSLVIKMAGAGASNLIILIQLNISEQLKDLL